MEIDFFYFYISFPFAFKYKYYSALKKINAHIIIYINTLYLSTLSQTILIHQKHTLFS